MHNLFLSAFIFLAISFFSVTNLSAETSGTPKNKGVLIDLEQCIAIALEAHPDISASASNVVATENTIGQARAGYYPQLDLYSAYRKYEPSSQITEHSFDEYAANARISQNIFNFGKTTTQVSIQKLTTDSSRYDMEDVKIQVVFEVKNRYYGVLKALRDRDVNEEIVEQFEQYLKQAESFYDVGLKPRIDVTKALAELSNAKLDLLKSENQLAVAKVALTNAMGIAGASDFQIEDNLAFQSHDIPFDTALRKAYDTRPDLKSLVERKRAAEMSVALQKKDYFPTLTANANYNFAGERFPLDHNWSADVTLNLPLFSGFLTKYRVGEAVANLGTISYNEIALRQDILLEVQQAHLNILEAAARIDTAEISVQQAEENLQLARGRYSAGLGSPIEVTDALVTYSRARSSYIQALYDYKVAQSTIEKAMGSK